MSVSSCLSGPHEMSGPIPGANLAKKWVEGEYTAGVRSPHQPKPLPQHRGQLGRPR